MRVVITDERFYERDPYRDAVEAVGAELDYLEWESAAELGAACTDATVIVTRRATISREIIEGADDARLIMRNGTGYDNVDILAATEHGIPVSNVPGYANDEVASHAIALMLAAAHEVVYEDRSLRGEAGWGDRRKYSPMHGGTFGIVGLGRIGRAAVPKARGLDMELVAYDPFAPADIFDALDVTRVSFEELLNRADCVSVHAPLNSASKHLFSTAEFDRMKDSAVVVNTGRGEIIDETALVDAVIDGDIFGAGIDVFENEPPEDSPIFETDRIVCSPHHAAETAVADDRCIEIGRNEIIRVLEGKPPRNLVNPIVLQTGVSRYADGRPGINT